jgi:hypothetical protein
MPARSRRLNIRDFTPDGTKRWDNAFRTAKQIAIHLQRQNPDVGAGFEIYFPSDVSAYQFDEPLSLDQPNMGLAGDGALLSRIKVAKNPAVIVGLRDSEVGHGGTTVRLTHEHRPPRNDVLDGSHGGDGVATRGDATITFHATPGALGRKHPDGNWLDNWTTIETLTIDLAIQGCPGFWADAETKPILTIGSTNSTLILVISKGGVPGQLDLFMTDSHGNPGRCSIQVDPGDGLKRIGWTIDLRAESRGVTAWLDRRQIRAGFSGEAFGPNGSGKWAQNHYSILQIGAGPLTTSDVIIMQRADAPIPDFTVYGLSLSSAAKYQVGAIGSRQQRADGQPFMNDGYAFGPGDYTDRRQFFTLQGSDPDRNSPGRLVAGWSNELFRQFYGYFVQKTCSVVQGGQRRNWIEGLGIEGNWLTTGPVVALFPVLDFSIRRSNLRMGTQLLSQVPSVASYQIHVEDVDFEEASDSPIAGFQSVIFASNVRFHQTGRICILAVGCKVTADGVNAYMASPNFERAYAAHGYNYGGSHRLTDWMIDAEGSVTDKEPFLFEQNDYLLTTATVEDIYLGTCANGKAIFRLVGSEIGKLPAVIEAKRIDAVNGKHTAIAIADAGWQGCIEVYPDYGQVIEGEGSKAITTGVQVAVE